MRWLLLLLVLLSASASRADTLLLANNSVLNGRVTYEGDRFEVRARFVGDEGAATRLFLAHDAVSRIEFNENDVNPGRSEGTQRMLRAFGLRPEGGEGAAPRVRVVTRDGVGGDAFHKLERISEDEVELSNGGLRTEPRGNVRGLLFER